MKKTIFLILGICVLVHLAYGQKPKVVVLGVGHSSQLVNYHQQPAAIRAFIDKVRPSSICIERSPEEYSRNDFYEFTYEQQYLVIPFAKEMNLPIYPIDWLPSDQDIDLAFGLKDLEKPKFVRQKNGFLGFTTFTEPVDFEDGLYFADQLKFVDSIASWYARHSESVAFDFPRRLFLYRTFLQSKRIQKVLEIHKPSDTVLVIIGAFHKNDIEKNLKQNGYEIIQPSSFGAVSEQDMRGHFRTVDAYAILSFNLLGMQSHLSKINHQLVKSALTFLSDEKSVEMDFFKLRYALLTRSISEKQAAVEYEALLERVGKQDLTWSGVKDRSRLDSYFDPFGNLGMEKRVRLEMARSYRRLSKEKEVEKQLLLISDGLNDYKKSMFKLYVEKYLF